MGSVLGPSLNVATCPLKGMPSVADSAVGVMARAIVRGTAEGEPLGAKLPAGSLNEAVMEWLPTASVETVRVAVPPAPTGTVPSFVEPAKKATLPEGVTAV